MFNTLCILTKIKNKNNLNINTKYSINKYFFIMSKILINTKYDTEITLALTYTMKNWKFIQKYSHFSSLIKMFQIKYFPVNIVLIDSEFIFCLVS